MSEERGTKSQDYAALMELVDRLSLKTPTEEQAEIAVYPPYLRESEASGTNRADEAERPSPQPLLVVAGAGSGKTETLSLRATYIAAKYGVSPENILGLTFTRKAAAELEQRLAGDRESPGRPGYSATKHSQVVG